MTRPVVLIVRDGWGVGASDPNRAKRSGNAVAMASTPIRDRLRASRPWSLLETSGRAVGLPGGMMGNSEVGHLNLGAGRIVPQDLLRISKAVREGAFVELGPLVALARRLRGSSGSVHLIGLCSDGGVHSHFGHLEALLEWARREELPTWVHAISDGRDTSPTAGLGWLGKLEARLGKADESTRPAGSPGSATAAVQRVASLSGRYYAMDRDGRWSRTEPAYRAMAEGAGPRAASATEHLERCYAEGVTDEFVAPVVIDPGGAIAPGDGIVMFNFRADRARQLAAALTQTAFPHFARPRGAFADLVAMTLYADDFRHPVLFPPRSLAGTLGETLASAGLRQLRVAETEKYAHVTYFFNGGVEAPFPGEDRDLIASPRVATYDLQPEMSAPEVTRTLLARLDEGGHDFVLVNYANADMVGHTGDIRAAASAVETVDACVGMLLERIDALGGAALVTADHGNAEKMLDDDGRPHTAHTTFPVECFLVGPESAPARLASGTLADVAPTVLELLGTPRPPEMTGRSLLRPSRAASRAGPGR